MLKKQDKTNENDIIILPVTFNYFGYFVFTPDSLLKLNTNYMVHIGRGMMQSGGMGDMGGHGGSVSQGHMMLHFKTK